MTLVDLIKLLDMNYSISHNDYDFFMLLIDHCIHENDHNPFERPDKDTIERGIRGQNGLCKANLKAVNQMRDVGRLAKFIQDNYPEDKQYIMESKIKESFPEFNPEGADFPYPCEDLFFECLDVYMKTRKKRTKKTQIIDEPIDAPPVVDVGTQVAQPVVQQIIQNQFNISQTGNGINVGHADVIEIRDGKVVTLK